MRFNKEILKNITRFTIKNEPLEGYYIKVFYMKSYFFGLFKKEQSTKSLYPYFWTKNGLELSEDFYKDKEDLKNRLK